jgi:hypothetical protein
LSRLGLTERFTKTCKVATLLSTLPQPFVIRTQYEVVTVNGDVVKEAELPPAGFEVSPLLPWYHWYVRGVVPLAKTVSVAV